MINQMTWLGKKEELEFRKQKFSDRRSTQIYLYSNYIDGLIRTRAIIFGMSVLVLFPVLINLISTGVFDIAFFVERFILGLILFISGLLFNKFRTLAIILGMIPVLLLLASCFVMPGQFDIRRISFLGAILLFFISGFYYNFKAKGAEKNIEALSLENQLIER